MNEVWHARSALSRVVESGSGGQDLAAGTWQRLEALSGISRFRACHLVGR